MRIIIKKTGIKSLLLALPLFILFPAARAGAMHITEGFLPPFWAGGWALLSLPFIIPGYFSLKKRVGTSRRNLLLFAMCGAFAFLLTSLKLPSLSGSCSHPTGVALTAILFGPAAVSVLSLIVLLFQALLLAHGGLTTLGANLFSMGIAGPFAAYWLYLLLKKARAPAGAAVFFTAGLDLLATVFAFAFAFVFAMPRLSIKKRV